MFLSLYPAFLIPIAFTDLQFLVVLIITIVVVFALQAITKDPRPRFTGYGFPSAHATITTLLTIWIILKLKGNSLIISIILTIFLILVCISRVYEGYHTVTQVIAGVFLGIIAIWIYFGIVKPN